jgi:hypothetical protein
VAVGSLIYGPGASPTHGRGGAAARTGAVAPCPDFPPGTRSVERRFELADGPALRPDGPRSGQSAPVGRTVRACAEQFRVPSFVLRLLAIFAELARNQLCKGSSPPPL